MNNELLRQMIDERYVSVQKHPLADLFIYNYTAKAQYSNTWNEVTLQCRGLILDASFNIVAKPFMKFFNLDELPAEQIPDEPFEVYEKMDGSLGVLYWLNDEPFIATRGSFISSQAAHATEILKNKYAGTFTKINRAATYLFEIVYPDNRIVVDYGNIDDLVLLAVIDNKTGADLPLSAIGFPLVKKYDGINDFKALKSFDDASKEGFVIKFKSGLRVKIKLAEYLRLHRIVTGVSNLVIWEHLSEDRSFEDLLEKVPDEFYEWVKKTIEGLKGQYSEILADSKSSFQQLDAGIHTNRRETAMYFQSQKYPAVLFALLDDKPVDKIIWKMIRPQYSKPFKTDE
ncbi:RNA ligase [Mucilaginibacter sp. OK098]|uniref:RNA ligase n=1 Tax=Mucilaginibacter sp. OK098 TaxID=1855297 RepID=UPI0009F9E7BD|nr:RNA ligase [Mucilaginibacter sp. OK098]